MGQYPVHPAIFHPQALAAIREFPKEVQRELGKLILNLQYGAKIGMPLSRPMPSVAQGVQELRVRDSSGIYRAFYLLKTQRGVLVFHAFQKKTQQTPKREIELGRRRLREVIYGQS